ncbi:hypothetical protein ACU635_31850 [[Actinomadura] parvosata]|uniref:hypothetical protein n=1 Tax=[Actinomadura] parvosata TaxID=1955412 RepID=UPI00406BF936
MVAAIGPGRHPVLARALAAGLGTPADHRDRFEYALDALLSGLRARRASGHAGRLDPHAASGDTVGA